MKRIATLCLLAVALTACETAPQPSGELPFYRSMARTGATVDPATAEELFNSYRRNKGLGPLSVDPVLQAAAESEAKAMAAADKPASADAVKARLTSAGAIGPAANLSAGYRTLAEAFSGWRESAQHDRVLLDPRATRMGIATAYTPNSKYKVYWVFVVAAAGQR